MFGFRERGLLVKVLSVNHGSAARNEEVDSGTGSRGGGGGAHSAAPKRSGLNSREQINFSLSHF